MDLNTSVKVSAGALRAQSLRMRVIAENLANASSVAPTAGGDPYRRKVAAFQSQLDRETGATGVMVQSVGTDRSDFQRVYQPGNPAADPRGYKGVQTEFSTLVSGGGMKGSYSAGGVVAVAQPLISKQGLLTAASSSTDLGIEGAGFFVTREGATPSSGVAFTRAGDFRPDDQGYLRNSAGNYLQGWPLDTAGNFTNTGSLTALQPVRLSDLTGTATATTRVQLRANLDASTTPFTGTYAAGDMEAGTVTPAFSRPFTVYDAQGASHTLNMAFLKTGANQWQAEIFPTPASDVTTTGPLASGTVKFNPDGSLDLAGSTPALFGALTPSWANQAGAQPIALKLGSDAGLDGLTQFGNQSAVIASTVDGGVLNNIASISVSNVGVVSAVFDNGISRPVFQLPIATFPNPDGLTRLNGNAYQMSDSSGNYAINEPGALGAGKVKSSALESSNVDLAGEFSNMIRFQRAYSAASKIITTVDDMLQEVSNLKR